MRNTFVHLFCFLYRTIFFLVLLFLFERALIIIFFYYLLQEFLGFIYLLGLSGELIFLTLLFKIGMSPFFFWTLVFGEKIFGLVFYWFLTFQKLYPVLVLFFLLSSLKVIFIILGVLLSYFFIWSLVGYKLMLILSSVERLGWLFLHSFFSSFVLIVIYLLTVFWLSQNMKFIEIPLFLISFPLRITFLIKLLGLMAVVLNAPYLIYFLVGLLFLSVCITSIIYFYIIEKYSPFCFSGGKLVLLILLPLLCLV